MSFNFVDWMRVCAELLFYLGANETTSSSRIRILSAAVDY